MRGVIASALILTLIAVVVATFVYLWWLSRKFAGLTPDQLGTVIPMVATTLLTPIVGLVGAVMGFYYGGQTAVQAASQTADATKAASETTQETAVRAVSQIQNGHSVRSRERTP